MSSRSFAFEVNRTTTASAATLYRLVCDGANWSAWARPVIVQSSWEREGEPAPGGVGAIRKVGLWPVLMREEIIELEQDRMHAYTFAGQAPVNDYRGQVVFTPKPAGGTDVHWTGTFTERVPGSGPVLRVALRGAIVAISARLVTAAERETPT